MAVTLLVVSSADLGIELHHAPAQLCAGRRAYFDNEDQFLRTENFMDLSASIPPDLQPLVTEWLASGRYESGQELLCDALRLLAEHDADDEAQELTILQEAVDEMDSGVAGKPFSRIL